jgi:hypothetical protein
VKTLGHPYAKVTIISWSIVSDIRNQSIFFTLSFGLGRVVYQAVIATCRCKHVSTGILRVLLPHNQIKDVLPYSRTDIHVFGYVDKKLTTNTNKKTRCLSIFKVGPAVPQTDRQLHIHCSSRAHKMTKLHRVDAQTMPYKKAKTRYPAQRNLLRYVGERQRR